jgi:quinol monooxygenase YgiN
MEKLVITIDCKKNKVKELSHLCLSVQDEILHLEGCKSGMVSQSRENERLIIVEQQWLNRTELNDYFRSELFTALLGGLKWLGKHYEITINDGTTAEGSSAMKTARLKTQQNGKQTETDGIPTKRDIK